MVEPITLYEMVGVPRHATRSEIIAAYRKAALACHPDLHPEDPLAGTKFKRLTAAYEVLQDAEKRRQYDQQLLREQSQRRAAAWMQGRRQAS